MSTDVADILIALPEPFQVPGGPVSIEMRVMPADPRGASGHFAGGQDPEDQTRSGLDEATT
jgi:hypothetical protein